MELKEASAVFVTFILIQFRLFDTWSLLHVPTLDRRTALYVFDSCLCCPRTVAEKILLIRMLEVMIEANCTSTVGKRKSKITK